MTRDNNLNLWHKEEFVNEGALVEAIVLRDDVGLLSKHLTNGLKDTANINDFIRNFLDEVQAEAFNVHALRTITAIEGILDALEGKNLSTLDNGSLINIINSAYVKFDDNLSKVYSQLENLYKENAFDLKPMQMRMLEMAIDSGGFSSPGNDSAYRVLNQNLNDILAEVELSEHDMYQLLAHTIYSDNLPGFIALYEKKDFFKVFEEQDADFIKECSIQNAAAISEYLVEKYEHVTRKYGVKEIAEEIQPNAPSFGLNVLFTPREIGLIEEKFGLAEYLEQQGDFITADVQEVLAILGAKNPSTTKEAEILEYMQSKDHYGEFVISKRLLDIPVLIKLAAMHNADAVLAQLLNHKDYDPEDLPLEHIAMIAAQNDAVDSLDAVLEGLAGKLIKNDEEAEDIIVNVMIAATNANAGDALKFAMNNYLTFSLNDTTEGGIAYIDMLLDCAIHNDFPEMLAIIKARGELVEGEHYNLATIASRDNSPECLKLLLEAGDFSGADIFLIASAAIEEDAADALALVLEKSKMEYDELYALHQEAGENGSCFTLLQPRLDSMVEGLEYDLSEASESDIYGFSDSAESVCSEDQTGAEASKSSSVSLTREEQKQISQCLADLQQDAGLENEAQDVLEWFNNICSTQDTAPTLSGKEAVITGDHSVSWEWV